jgi:hypothetical protein
MSVKTDIRDSIEVHQKLGALRNALMNVLALWPDNRVFGGAYPHQQMLRNVRESCRHGGEVEAELMKALRPEVKA